MDRGFRFQRDIDRFGHVQQSFIDRELLHGVGMAFQNFHQRMRILPVDRKIRRNQNEVRALPECLHYGISRMNAIFLGRDGTRGDDTVPCLHIPSHGGRNIAQVRRVRLFLQPL